MVWGIHVDSVSKYPANPTWRVLRVNRQWP